MKALDLKGQIFGRLEVINFSRSAIKGGKTRRLWVCKCKCGKEVEVETSCLREGVVQSCGCLAIERIQKLNYKHGEGNKTIEYKTWSRLISRCYCETDRKYKSYGGRGITVCDRWRTSYENFLQDMGRRPEGKMSIDRIDVNKGYSPDNCRWADDYTQGNNKTTNVFLELNGETLTMKQWADKLGIGYKWFHAQLRYKNKTLQEIYENI